MSRDHTQEAYDEYYSTGIGQTGGDNEEIIKNFGSPLI